MKKTISRDFTTKKDTENFARSFLCGIVEHGDSSLFFSKEDKRLLEKIRELCGDTAPLDAIKFWLAEQTERALRYIERNYLEVLSCYALRFLWGFEQRSRFKCGGNGLIL